MKFKRENKGFSLVELIVVIAIFSVVGVVVGSFLFAASRAYSINANELTLQDEAQLVANQVQEMFLDTSYGVSYQYVATDATGAELIQYMENDAATPPAGTLTKKDIFIYGKDHYYHLFWKKDVSQLYLLEYAKNASGDYAPVEGMPSEGVLLGEFITDFTVDLSKVASDRMISFNIMFEKQGTNRDYLVARTVSLRNDVMTNKTAEEVYNAAGVEFQPLADNLDVDPKNEITLWPGGTQQYQVTLTCSRGGVPSQNASWAISSMDAGVTLSEDTKISGGNFLTIGLDEESTRLRLDPTAQGYDFTHNQEKTLTLNNPLYVNIRQIRNLSISNNSFETSPVSAGGTYNISVDMTGDNLPLNLTDAGGITAAFTVGSEYASITNVTYSHLTANYTIVVKDNAPENAEIGLVFKPAREGFTDIFVQTSVYKVGNASDEVLRVYNDNADASLEWERLGEAKTRVEFANPTLEESYCNADGSLKSGYSIRYTYRILDSNNNLVRTAKSTKGTNNSQEITDYLKSITHESAYKSKAVLSDKVFLQSGMVIVSAELIHNTAGTPVVVGGSNVLTYFIPEATIGFRRANSDVYSSNLKAYITNKQNVASIYINFPSGFATTGYQISLAELSVEGTEYGNVNSGLSDLSKNRIAIVGKADAEYKLSKNNTIELTYGGLPNTVSVILTTPNVIGTNYYVPLTQDEWTNHGVTVDGTDEYAEYSYFIDDSHRMYIQYLNGQFNQASLYIMENLQWKEVKYTMNKLNKTWELATP